MKKIVLVVSGLSNGGVESFILNFFSEINLVEKYDKYIITHNKPSKDVKVKIENLGFKIFTVPSKKESFYRNIKSIDRIFIENRFDIVHSHMAKSNFIIMKLAKKNGVPLRIAHSHQSMKIDNGPKKIIHKLIQYMNRKYANKFVGCSEDALIYGFGKKILNNNYSSLVLHNAINLERFSFNDLYRNQLRRRYNISDDEVLIGSIGRFTYQKNQQFLLEIINKLVKVSKKNKLLLIGEGELKDDYLWYIKNNKLQDNVILESPQCDIYKYYSAFDIFVFPSRFEGLGIVIIEAQANGLKCIVSKNIPKDVKQSNLIEFIDINSIEEWYDKLINIKKRTNRRIDLTSSDYNIKKEYKKLIEIYNSET
jgi:putative glycosyl transferase, group 1